MRKVFKAFTGDHDLSVQIRFDERDDEGVVEIEMGDDWYSATPMYISKEKHPKAYEAAKALVSALIEDCGCPATPSHEEDGSEAEGWVLP